MKTYLLSLSLLVFSACASTNNNTQPTPSAAEVNSSDSKLVIQDKVVGTGDEAVNGKRVTVHYVGTFTDGRKFDSSIDRGMPFTLMLGEGQVIKGWDQGILGMKVGGKRKLTIPPELGYGARKVGPIPANSILIFEVELLDVK